MANKRSVLLWVAVMLGFWLCPRIALAEVSENFETGTLGGAWPSQWTLETTADTSFITTTAAFSTAGQLGRMTGTADSGGNEFLSAPGAALDSDQSVDIATSNALNYADLIARRGTAGNYYGCLVGMFNRLRFYKVVGGVYAQVGPTALVTPPAGVSSIGAINTWYRLRFKVTQNSNGTTTLQAKLWQGSEPSGWTLALATPDDEPTLQNVPGYSGMGGAAGHSTGQYIYLDNYALTTGDCSGGCQTAQACTADTDCAPGLACGTNNGGCFNGARRNKVCWPTQCQDGVTPDECGQPSSPCGPNCACVDDVCDPANSASTCPAGETCKPGLGQLFGSDAAAVCVTTGVCPSNDPATCGSVSALCGKECICTSDCSTATAANPDDHCGGVCPHLCAMGQQCCSSDLNCPTGAFCDAQPSGAGICRPGSCAYQHLAPPLCGSADAPCGAQCPECTPECDGRECGADAACGTSCGTCSAGQFCTGDGHCLPTASTDPPLHVLDGQGNPIPLPIVSDAPTAPVGALAGQFSVTEQGTAQFNVPIDVPPGRAGMEPGVSLRYIGSKASGEAGIGWKIEGLSQITRCPKIYALDGYSAPVANDTSDHFCIDGKRLETVPGSSPYGSNGAQYRTLVDGFSKVISRIAGPNFQQPFWLNVPRVNPAQQGPDYFEVWTKDGRKLTYGSTRDSLLVGRNGVRFSWLLNRVEDRAGNSMTVRYHNLRIEVPAAAVAGVPNMVRPASIFYTGHGLFDGNREVRFDYENRSDAQISYGQGGVPLVVAYRLKQITTFVRGTAVKDYFLDYKSATVSQLTQIKECAAGTIEVCKPPTVFEYIPDDPRAPAIGESGQFSQLGGRLDLLAVEGAAQLDVNGDGIPDFLITKVSIDGVPAQTWMKPTGLALDGGWAVGSVFLATPLGPVGALAAGVAFDLIKTAIFGALSASPKITFASNVLVGSPNRTGRQSLDVRVPCPSAQSFVMDFDQDGRDDIVSICNQGLPEVAVSTGTNFTINHAPIVTLPTPPGSGPTGSGWSSVPPPIFYDINGDSLQDVLSCTSPTHLDVRLRLGANLGFGPAIPMDGQFLVQDVDVHDIFEFLPYCSELVPTYQTFDIDGDGTPELLAHFTATQVRVASVPTQRTTGWYALRYDPTASPQLSWSPVNLPIPAGNAAYGQDVVLGDLNGDGLTDIWHTSGRGVGGLVASSEIEHALWLNTGGAFAPTTPSVSGTMPAVGDRLTASVLVDHDGDGRLDILQHWVTPNAFSDPVSGAREDLHYNLGFLINSLATQVDGEDAADVSFLGSEARVPGRFTVAGDVDGDGNIDLFGQDPVYYGSGLHKMLLSRVTDGVGNIIEVNYDEPDTYKASCLNGQQWPERCVPRMSGLVSSHTESFDDPTVLGGERIGPHLERSYRYTYEDGRINVSGHGWLGFGRRAVTETVFLPQSDGFIDQQTRVTTEFLAPARYKPSGALMDATDTAWPYLYPLAGMPSMITTDRGMPGSLAQSTTLAQSPIEDGGHSRRTAVRQNWGVHMSADHRPFPVLNYSETKTFSRSVPVDDTAAFDQDGAPRTDCVDSNLFFDGYGNVTDNKKYCGVADDIFETLETTTSYDQADTTNWFIADANRITTISSRGGSSQPQVIAPHFDPQTGLLASVTRDPGGDNHTVTYVRDPDGFGTVVHVEESAAGETTRTTDITYDADHVFPTTITNARGHVTQVAYDPRFGQVAGVVDPNGVSSQKQFDGFGRLAQSITPEGTTTYQIAGLTGAQSLTAAGKVYSRLVVTAETRGTSGSFGGRTRTEIDSLGRVVRSSSLGVDERGTLAEVVTERSFDCRGRLTMESAPHLDSLDIHLVPTVAYSYDYLDRVTQVEHSDGSVATTAYASGVALSDTHSNWLADPPFDSLPVSLSAVDVELHTATHFPDEPGKQSVVMRDYLGLISRTIDDDVHPDDVHPNGGDNLAAATPQTNNYDYGPFDRLRQLTDNGGATTSLVYYPFGQVEDQRDPDSGLRHYTYNGFGELATSLDGTGQPRAYSYDVLGRLDHIDDAMGTTRWIYDQCPDNDPCTTEEAAAAGALGRLTQTVSPTLQRVNYDYEPITPASRRGLPRSVTYSIDQSVYTITPHYDDLGRISTIDYPVVGAGTPIHANYYYRADSGTLNEVKVGVRGEPGERSIWRLDSIYQGILPAQVTFGNGAVSSFQYDGDRRWLNSATTTLGGGTIQDLGYEHFGNGQVSERFAAFASQGYTYDNLGRLASVQDFGPNGPSPARPFHYDTHGNLTQNENTTITFGDPVRPHLPTQVGSSTYSYSPNTVDKLASRSGPEILGGTQTFSYTPFELPSQITTGPHVTQLDYTADQFRVVRHDSDSRFVGDSTRHYASDLYQRLVSGAEERFRITAGGAMVAEIIRRPGDEDQTLYFHPDNIGTPETITDDAKNVTHQDHSPFGTPGSPPTLDGVSTQIGFTGQPEDADLGLTDMGGRIYDPLAGRFTTADPMMQAPFGLTQGQNRYAYVFNDPINMTDPSGFISTGSTGGDITTGAVLGAAYGGVAYGVGTELLSGLAMPAAGSVGIGLGGGAANLLIDLIVDPGAPGASYSYKAPAPSSAAHAMPSKSTAGAAQARSRVAPLEKVQEKAPPHRGLTRPKYHNPFGNSHRYVAGGGGGEEDDEIDDEEWDEIINGPRMEPERNPYGTTEEQEFERNAFRLPRYFRPPDGTRMSVDDALDSATEYLGKGYRDAGNGRFVSSDGLRQVRIGDSDILGLHGGGPHVNFEQLEPDPLTGRMQIVGNSHVYLTDF